MSIFISKEFSYQDLSTAWGRGGVCPPPPDMIRQKYPGTEWVKKIADNRTFCVVPPSSNKFSKSEKINLTEENKTILNDD